jgi:hypothetical protein
MSWNCVQCGNENTGEVSTCRFCHYARIATGLRLVSDETGRAVECRLATVFGSRTLKRLGDSGLKFVSPEQFRVEKNLDGGGWTVTHLPYAQNPTFLNGTPIPAEGSSLSEGDKLSIKGMHFQLSVFLLP